MNTHQIKTQPMDEEQLEKIKKGIIQVYLFLLGNFGPLPYAAIRLNYSLNLFRTG